MSIDEVRQIPAGTYFENDGIAHELIDVPTDGPLFRRLDDGFEVQLPTEQFLEGDWQRVNIEKILDRISVELEMSGTEHQFQFTHVENSVWPKMLVQGGESYRMNLEDVPTFVAQIIEDHTDAQLEER